jgi:hypothetical protein
VCKIPPSFVFMIDTNTPDGKASPYWNHFRSGGQGVITESHVVWKLKRGVSNKPSVLLVGELLYIISDAGIASCIEAATGKVLWQERIGGEFSASPAYADGKIWLSVRMARSVSSPLGRRFNCSRRTNLVTASWRPLQFSAGRSISEREPICIGSRSAKEGGSG